MDDEDTPPPQGQHPEPDLGDDPIELDTGGDPPSQPPGGGTQQAVHDNFIITPKLLAVGHGSNEEQSCSATSAKCTGS